MVLHGSRILSNTAQIISIYNQHKSTGILKSSLRQFISKILKHYSQHKRCSHQHSIGHECCRIHNSTEVLRQPRISLFYFFKRFRNKVFREVCKQSPPPILHFADCGWPLASFCIKRFPRRHHFIKALAPWLMNLHKPMCRRSSQPCAYARRQSDKSKQPGQKGVPTKELPASRRLQSKVRPLSARLSDVHEMNLLWDCRATSAIVF